MQQLYAMQNLFAEVEKNVKSKIMMKKWKDVRNLKSLRMW